jgi:hypothetical protein
MPAGRPSKYYPELCDELEDFFNVEPYEEKDGKRIPNDLPTLVSFARKKNISLSAIYDWIDPKHASFHPEFLQTYERVVKHAQKEHILQNGLQGLFTPQFTKFVAVNLTDMREQGIFDNTDGLESVNITFNRVNKQDKDKEE